MKVVSCPTHVTALNVNGGAHWTDVVEGALNEKD